MNGVPARLALAIVLGGMLDADTLACWQRIGSQCWALSGTT